MRTLSIKLDNCFGIKKFEHVLNFDTNSTILIYAPNGMMKSSFALAFDKFSKKKILEIKDRIA